MTDPAGDPGTPGPDAPQESGRIEAAVDSVWARVRDTVLERVDVLDDAVAALVEGRLDEDIRAEAEQAAHKLAGSAGTFGAAEASGLARRLEHRFATVPEPTQAPTASEEVVALRTALEAHTAGAGNAGAPAAADHRPMVLLLTADDQLAQRLRAAGAARGLDTRAAGAESEARELLEVKTPAAVVIDGRLGSDEAVESSRGSAAAGERVPRAISVMEALSLPRGAPTLLLTDAETQPHRVAAARAGVDGYLPRGTDADEVAALLEERLATADAGRVLACDDDASVLAAVKAILADLGLTVNTVADSRRFWEAVAAAQPDLVLLDVTMPHVDGLELCRTLRSDPAHADLPVVFLTGHTDRASVQQAFEAGADDVVNKPLVDAELRARVGNRLERTRLLRRLADRDPVTDLRNRRATVPALEQLLRTARRHQQPLSLAVLDVDRFKELTHVHGHAAADGVLRDLGHRLQGEFGGGDVTGRWGGDELVVGMYGMGRHDAVQRLAELLEGLRTAPFEGDGGTFRVSFSAGVAEHPADGQDVETLYRASYQAVRSAKHAGGDQVRAVGAGDDGDDRCDVLVVEDDAAVSDMLSHALLTRGYQVELLEDGGEAFRRLAGEEADLDPRVMLLDVGLPALSGLNLLTELGHRGLLERMHVVMLTGHAGEDEVVEALRLGAVDHVAKPFSVPVLLERVRHALAG